MSSVCFYFQVHQPHRLKRYRIFDIGKDRNYFDSADPRLSNEAILRKVAGKCYLPANRLLLDLIRKYPKFKVSFSISGTALEQFEKFAPDVLQSFVDLVETGNVEILSETYYHSLAFLYSPEEFRNQVELHKKLVKRIFGVTPQVFRNTELIYNNDIAREVERMGYAGIIAEGADRILGWRSPNFLYRPLIPDRAHNLKLLLKNYRLSDDIAFRFGNKDWEGYPLTAPKFGQWVSAHNGNGEVLNLFMDYETFGEHQWESTGIFDFLRALPEEVLRNPDNDFVTPSEAVSRYRSVAELDIPDYVSWADIERDLSAWLSNDMQREALKNVYELEEKVRAAADEKLMEDWRRLLTSDHFYYMCTKWFADGDVHKYFNPYESPYDAFISYMNVLKDMRARIEERERSAEYRIPIRKLAIAE
ncbi:MAG TPA: glycoside hydrolase family 57 protein [Candidatus Paceibacterota bacterium]|jgi:alpha-amylase|nr:glycoside hydrolase family 57 protein [Candidatus Paceibacterota bacterium]